MSIREDRDYLYCADRTSPSAVSMRGSLCRERITVYDE
jgi:hypothetical protein